MCPGHTVATAGLILHHAAVMTMDGEYPTASLVAISGNIIIGVGNEDSLVMSRLKDGGIIRSVRGKTVIVDEARLRLLSEGPPQV